MGMSIVESAVPFDLDRPLTKEEKCEVEEYNRADLRGTLERFKQRQSAFKTKMMLVKEFDLSSDYICKSNAKLTEAILLSQNKGLNTRLKRNFQLCDLPIDLSIPEVKIIYDFFIEALRELETHNWETAKCDKKKLSMNLDILGLTHTYALGGVHAGTKNYILNPHTNVCEEFSIKQKLNKILVWLDVG